MKRTSYSRFLARAAVTLLAVLFSFTGARAQETVTIGSLEGASTDSYLPMNSLYNYSYTQQIYTADEIGMAGTINSITVWMYGNADLYEMPFDIYMVETDKEAFTSNSDWVTVTADDIVYSGSVTVHNTDAEAYTFELNTPFEYSGNGNLVICFDNNTGNWKGGLNGMVFTAGDDVVRSIYVRLDGNNFDPTNMAGISATGTLAKRNVIQLGITPGSASSCERPTNLVATVNDAHSATLTWDSEVGDYIVEYKLASLPDVDENWTAASEDDIDKETYTLTGLLQNTTYNARVQAVCDAEANDYSAWKKVTFTTPVSCPAPTDLAVTLTPGNGSVATLAWTENGDPAATSWQICLNDDETNLIAAATNPFQLTGLTPETAYTAKVRAVGDGEFSSWTDNITFTPTDAYSITVNDGTATNSFVPVYGTWVDSHSKSQFIIPADALADMAYGTINKLTFYSSNTAVNWGAAEFEVYMTEVGYTTFESATLVDWTSMDKVMNAGSLAIVGNKMEITLDAPYQYLGGNLLIGILQPTSGTWGSCAWYGVTIEDNVAIGGYESSKALGLQKFLPKTTFDYTPGEAPTVLKPFGLAVNYESGVTAEVSWTQKDDAKDWIVAYKAEDDEEFTEVTVTNTPQYTLSGLELGTTYEVKVRAKVGSDVSEWTAPVTFTTDACMPEDMIVVNYTLNDSYGDGWNSNYILVVDENCNVVETLTIENGNSATGTVKLCGKVAQFMWYKGNYGNETSWSFTDAEGNVLFEGAGNADMQTYDLLYSIDLNPYSMPTDIAVSEVGSHTATVSWTETGTATAWQIGFYNDEGAIDNIVDADSNPFTLTGLDPETDYYVVVRAVGAEGESNWPCLGADFTTDVAFPAPADLAVNNIGPHSADISWTGNANSYKLRYRVASRGDNITESFDEGLGDWTTIDADGDGHNWNLSSVLQAGLGFTPHSGDDMISSESYGRTDGALFPDNYLVSPQVTLGGSISFWANAQDADYAAEHFGVAVSTTSNTDPAAFTTIQEWTLSAKRVGVKVDRGTTRSGNRDQGAWYQYTVDLSAYSGQGYVAIRHFNCSDEFILNIDDITIVEPSGTEESWTVVENVTSPYTINGLDAETNYAVQVQAAYTGEYVGESAWSETTFTTEIATPAPTDLSVTPLVTTAEVSWNGLAESYELEYAEGSFAGSWLKYDDGIFSGSIGNSSASTWTWGVMYPGSMITSTSLTKVSIFEKSSYNTEDITINIYQGGDNAPETLLYTETVTPNAADAFHEITLATPVDITPGENLWITLTEYGTYVLGHCASDEPNNNWVLNGNSWAHVSDLSSSLAGYGWMIRAEIAGDDPSTATWIPVSNPTSPCTLEGLTAETTYTFRVRGYFGDEGYSDWTMMNFTTKSVTEDPIDLAAEDITSATATLSWTGYQESYNVRYRVPESIDPFFADNFDNGLDNWTTIDADGDGYDWVLGSECGGVYLAAGGSLAGTGHNASDDLVVSGSYSNSAGVALTPDNYLVSPQVPLGGKVSFWVAGQDANYAAEHFGVAVSTSGNTDPADFTTIKEWTLNADGTGTESKDQGTWGKFTVDLSAYKGQTGYIAIRHFDCTDQFMLDLDDFVYGEAIPAGEWIEATVTENTLAISGLTPETEYEWQVQGIYEGGVTEWVSDNFTTLPLIELVDNDLNATEKNSDIIGANDTQVADVKLKDRTLYTEVWNTLCLPFNLTLAGSPLEGATVKTLQETEENGDVISLKFGEQSVTEMAAGKPYIVKLAGNENIAEPVFTGVTINATTDHAVTSGDVQFIGYYNTLSLDPENDTDDFDAADVPNIYYLKGDGKLHFTGVARTLSPLRAYFKIAASTKGRIVLDFGDGEVTGISDINSDTTSNGDWYNVNGMKLNQQPSRKGLYIQNGRKVVIK